MLSCEMRFCVWKYRSQTEKSDPLIHFQFSDQHISPSPPSFPLPASFNPFVSLDVAEKDCFVLPTSRQLLQSLFSADINGGAYRPWGEGRLFTSAPSRRNNCRAQTTEEASDTGDGRQATQATRIKRPGPNAESDPGSSMYRGATRVKKRGACPCRARMHWCDQESWKVRLSNANSLPPRIIQKLYNTTPHKAEVMCEDKVYVVWLHLLVLSG